MGGLAMFDGGLVRFFGEDVSGLTWEAIEVGIGREFRWSGQTREPWPVALHQVAVAQVLLRLGASPAERLAGLVHDVEESILGDVPTPLKAILRVCTPSGEVLAYDDGIGRPMRRRCIAALGLPPSVMDLTEGPAVTRADRIVLLAEARVLCPAMLSHLGPVDEDDEELVSLSQRFVREALANPRLVGSPGRAWVERVRSLRAAQ